MIGVQELITKVGDRWIPNLSSKAVIPYSATFDIQNPLPVHINAVGVPTPPYPITWPRLNLEGGMEAGELVFEDATDTTALADWNVLFTDSNRRYMNFPCHVRTICGTAQLPGIIRQPLWGPGSQRLETTLIKNAGAAVDVRMYFNGLAYSMRPGDQYKWVRERRNKAIWAANFCHPYWLTIDQNVELGASITENNFDIKIGENLELFSVAAVSDFDFAYEVSEPTLGQTIMNGKIAASAGIGDARYPTIFDTPLLLPVGSRLRITLDNLAASRNRVFITFQGRKLLVPLKDVPPSIWDIDTLYPPPSSWRIQKEGRKS